MQLALFWRELVTGPLRITALERASSGCMYAAAPRVARAFLERVAKIDDRSEPMAETYRRIRSLADEQGIPRPSYERIRRHLRSTRLRDDERKRVRTLAFELAYNTRSADQVVADLLRLVE